MNRISLFIGGIAPLPASGRPTGMFKQPVTATLELAQEGLAGDAQADRRAHGGPEKAVHLYPATHYARLAGAPINMGAGVFIRKFVGDKIKKGDILFTIYAENKSRLENTVELVKVSDCYLIK